MVKKIIGLILGIILAILLIIGICTVGIVGIFDMIVGLIAGSVNLFIKLLPF